MSEKKDGSTFNFDHKRRSLIEYMKVKMDEGDWHGVSDAANDLRVLEAHFSAIRSGLEIERHLRKEAHTSGLVGVNPPLEFPR